MSQKISFLLLLITGTLLSAPLWAKSDDNSSMSAARTTLLRQATGSLSTSVSPANPGYKTYVESVLNISSDSASSVTNKQFQQPIVTGPIEDPLLTDLKKSQSLNLDDKSRVKTREENKSPLQKSLDTRLRGQEDFYQQDREKANREYEENQKQMQEKALLMKSELEAQKKTEPRKPGSKLNPSLANNPFYFSEQESVQFSDMLPLIISRLTQRGYTRLEAENMLENTGSTENAVLALMDREGFSYGDAVDVIGVQASNEQSPSNQES